MREMRLIQKSTGIPVLSKGDMNGIAEQLIYDFCPAALRVPQAIDVDSFAQIFLGMEQDYQLLSHCGVYLGMTVFNDTNKVPVYCPESGRAEYVSARANTIIIDNSLLEPGQEHRYRFTMGHEAAHGFLHKAYFYNRMYALGSDDEPMIQCRMDGRKAGRKPRGTWDDHDWMEWQANAMSSAILMPASMVRVVVANAIVPCVETAVEAARAYCRAIAVSNTFNVSFEAASYRLKDSGLVRNDLYMNPSMIDFLDVDWL